LKNPIIEDQDIDNSVETFINAVSNISNDLSITMCNLQNDNEISVN